MKGAKSKHARPGLKQMNIWVREDVVEAIDAIVAERNRVATCEGKMTRTAVVLEAMRTLFLVEPK